MKSSSNRAFVPTWCRDFEFSTPAWVFFFSKLASCTIHLNHQLPCFDFFSFFFTRFLRETCGLHTANDLVCSLFSGYEEWGKEGLGFKEGLGHQDKAFQEGP